mmetsp:Transcript_14421/g.24165  ORF Transcript_14421/g.24165 Transcript_14421/m.24165 type:complete len:83 (+) Transcript_14421:396-644(+)
MLKQRCSRSCSSIRCKGWRVMSFEAVLLIGAHFPLRWRYRYVFVNGFTNCPGLHPCSSAAAGLALFLSESLQLHQHGVSSYS